MSNLLKRRKKLTDPEVRYYLLQLIGALQYLHQGLVIHRDLKLGNLFIDSQMRLKVGDFGLATRLTNASERKKTFCGTPNYIGMQIILPSFYCVDCHHLYSIMHLILVFACLLPHDETVHHETIGLNFSLSRKLFYFLFLRMLHFS